MYNLHLVFTIHEESGICNSKELLKIIDSIHPEIIFEELEEAAYDRIYRLKNMTTLESDAIKEYLKEYPIPHIPVDTFSRPMHFHEDCDRMRLRITGMASRDSFDYKNYIDYQESLVSNNGFKFLNSNSNDTLLDEIDKLKERVLKAIDDKELHQISAMEREINEKREDEILNNIYSYCKGHTFNQGLLFIGAGHRKAMLKKIQERNSIEDIKLNWKLLNNGIN